MNLKNRKRLVLEQFEDRLVPAFTFNSIVLDGAGNLTVVVTPGAVANSLTITKTATGATVGAMGTYAVTGNINVTVNNSVTAYDVTYAAGANALPGSLNVRFGNSTALKTFTTTGTGPIAGSLNFTGGSGNDSVTVDGLAVAGSVYINTGVGTLDQARVAGPATIGGNLVLQGVDSITLNDRTIGGSVISSNSDGDNHVANVAAGTNVAVGGDFIYTGGSGNDSVTTGAGLSVGRMLSLNLANGQNTAAVASTVLGNTTVVSGTGNDSVTLSGIFLGNVTVFTDGGDDVVLLSGTYMGNLNVNTADGNDLVTYSAVAGNGVVLNTGNGDDSFTMTTTNFTSFNADLGNGTDVFTPPAGAIPPTFSLRNV